MEEVLLHRLCSKLVLSELQCSRALPIDIRFVSGEGRVPRKQELTPGSQTALRHANQNRVIETVRASGPLTQAEIARATGLSPATVSNVVRTLREQGQVSVEHTSCRGRRARAVTLRRAAGAMLAVEFGVDYLEGILVDHGERVVANERIIYDVAAGPERGLRRAVWLVETLLGQARLNRWAITRAVAAFPGPLDPQTGEVGASCLMPRWCGTRPAVELSQRLNISVLAENEANLGAVGEYHEGAASGRGTVVYLHLGHGIGAGILLNGELLRGVGGTAGEIGHIALDERGQVCRCGNRGCLETLAGTPYLLGMLPPHADGEQPQTLSGVIAAARAHEPRARRILAEAGTALGRGTAMLVNLVNPELVVVGGPLATAGELLLTPMRQGLELAALPSAQNRVEIVPGALGAQAILRGALRHVLVSP